jgi:hypothetical protein
VAVSRRAGALYALSGLLVLLCAGLFADHQVQHHRQQTRYARAAGVHFTMSIGDGLVLGDGTSAPRGLPMTSKAPCDLRVGPARAGLATTGTVDSSQADAELDPCTAALDPRFVVLTAGAGESDCQATRDGWGEWTTLRRLTPDEVICVKVGDGRWARLTVHQFSSQGLYGPTFQFALDVWKPGAGT